ncbi:MAG: Crp/Fnr family transcriptional regulator [Salibacteraceae bacterium]
MSTVVNQALAFVNQIEDFSKETFQTKTYSRNEYVIREGDVERYVYVVLSGAIRAFYVSDREEFTIRFGYKDSIINSIGSFISGKPSEFYLQALRKTELKLIPKAHYLNFVNSSIDILRVHNDLMGGVITSQMEREIDLLTTSPIERYQRVLERSPQLFQEIPLKYIASYLRMTPETLSRLRNS